MKLLSQCEDVASVLAEDAECLEAACDQMEDVADEQSPDEPGALAQQDLLQEPEVATPTVKIEMSGELAKPRDIDQHLETLIAKVASVEQAHVEPSGQASQVEDWSSENPMERSKCDAGRSCAAESEGACRYIFKVGAAGTSPFKSS